MCNNCAKKLNKYFVRFFFKKKCNYFVQPAPAPANACPLKLSLILSLFGICSVKNPNLLFKIHKRYLCKDDIKIASVADHDKAGAKPPLYKAKILSFLKVLAKQSKALLKVFGGEHCNLVYTRERTIRNAKRNTI